MGGLSLWAKNKLLDHSLGKASWTMPTTIYVAMFTSDPDPGDASGNPSGTEVSYTGYARQAVTHAAASGGASTSDVDVTFPSAGSSGGTAQYVGYMDASSGGHLIWSGPMSPSQVIGVGTQVQFAAGQLDPEFT